MDFKNDKDKLTTLANLMNEQSETPTIVTDDLIYVFDAALEPEEVDFLLKMGGGSRRRADIEARVGLPKEAFDRIFNNLLDKSHIAVPVPPAGNAEPEYYLMSIFPGWFEIYLMGGAHTPDRQEFARRLTEFFNAATVYPPEVINEIMQDVAPHRSLAVVNPPDAKLLQVNEDVQPEIKEIYPAHSILNLYEQLDEDEIVTLSHCFCREHRKVEGDPCRVNLPEESCMAVGPAAQHLIDRGIGRRITRDEAVRLIKEYQEKGVIHQVGRLMPLKDVYTKYEIDILCNCCWDCCAAFGNYNRGLIPFMLKAYYVAHIPDIDACTGCGTCEEFCPVRAVSVNEDALAEINPDMCCGCGLCALHCPEEVIQMKPFERDVFLPILEGPKRRIS
jgi:Pyruvate/2-oxoacid:ferredoxin oxidoreductase delta subunit